MILNLRQTTAGAQALWDANNTGLDLTLTHIAIGDQGGGIDASLTALRGERERAAVTGRRIHDNQIHLNGAFAGAQSYWVMEVGVFAEDLLVYHWSSAGDALGHKSADFEWVLGVDLMIDPVADSALAITAQAPAPATPTQALWLARVLQALCDTNRLILQNHYLKRGDDEHN